MSGNIFKKRLGALKDTLVTRWRETMDAPSVAVLKMHGAVGKKSIPFVGGSAVTADDMCPLIEKAFTMKGVNAVVLSINSPGGSPDQGYSIAQEVRYWADQTKVPVIAVAEDVCGSSGYWIACAADEIYASPMTLVGSIGTVNSHFGFDKLMEILNIERRVYSTGEHKTFLDPFAPRDEKQEEIYVNEVLKPAEQHFCNWVAERRGDRLSKPVAELATGQGWIAQSPNGVESAESLGLIDGIGSLRGVLRSEFGHNVCLKRVHESHTKTALEFVGLTWLSLAPLFFLRSGSPKVTAQMAEGIGRGMVAEMKESLDASNDHLHLQ